MFRDQILGNFERYVQPNKNQNEEKMFFDLQRARKDFNERFWGISCAILGAMLDHFDRYVGPKKTPTKKVLVGGYFLAQHSFQNGFHGLSGGFSFRKWFPRTSIY